MVRFDDDRLPSADHEKADFLSFFDSQEVGYQTLIPISWVRPSQADDGKVNDSVAPVPVYYDQQRNVLLLLEGNHRYFTQLRQGKSKIAITKAERPL